MINNRLSLLENILNALPDPILVANTHHKIIYLNKAAQSHYENGQELLHQNLLDCHNPTSRKIMKKVLSTMQEEGLNETIISENDHTKTLMCAIRDNHGMLLGYYERYEAK